MKMISDENSKSKVVEMMQRKASSRSRRPTRLKNSVGGANALAVLQENHAKHKFSTQSTNSVVREMKDSGDSKVKTGTSTTNPNVPVDGSENPVIVGGLQITRGSFRPARHRAGQAKSRKGTKEKNHFQGPLAQSSTSTPNILCCCEGIARTCSHSICGTGHRRTDHLRGLKLSDFHGIFDPDHASKTRHQSHQQQRHQVMRNQQQQPIRGNLRSHASSDNSVGVVQGEVSPSPMASAMHSNIQESRFNRHARLHSSELSSVLAVSPHHYSGQDDDHKPGGANSGNPHLNHFKKSPSMQYKAYRMKNMSRIMKPGNQSPLSDRIFKSDGNTVISNDPFKDIETISCSSSNNNNNNNNNRNNKSNNKYAKHKKELYRFKRRQLNNILYGTQGI